MGLCQSEEERKQIDESRQIDRRLKESHDTDRRTIKLLLLGTGECGKTTLIKQMRILHSNGFTEAELMQQRTVVYGNTVKAMVEMLRAMKNFKIAFQNPQRGEDAQVVLQTLEQDEESKPLSEEVAEALKRLWADPAISEATYSRRLEFHLHESAKHFFDSLDRICDPNYCPTYTDMLLTRVRTTGIAEVGFIIKGIYFRVFDVGGQRSERKKWIHCFEGVNALIFITAVSEYDQVLFEDGVTNRLQESVRLFETLCNSQWFFNTSIILFLNKKDLFEEKIRLVPISACFPNYEGPQTYNESMNYIKEEFEKLNNNPKKAVYAHETCATDTNQIQLILETVITTVIKNNFQKLALR